MKEKKKFNLGNYHRLIGTFLALLLVAALATSLGVAANMKENYELELDNNYKKAYHEAMDSLSDVELKLSKVSVSEGVTTQQTLLSEIWMNSEIAENNIAQLSGRDGNTETIIRFLNQLGDYCHYLSEKLTDQPLDEQEKEKLDSLYGIVRSLQDSFKSAEEGIMQNATLVGRMDEGIMLLGDCYEHFNNDSNIEYPEMIYDGPFSDALAIRNAQYLNSLIAVSEADAQQKVREIFSDLQNLEYLEKTAGNIPSYVYRTQTEGGEGTAQISEKGGKLVLFTSNREISDETLNVEQCAAEAEELLVKMGYTNLELVWVTPADSTVYLNYVYHKDEIRYYPDFVKLKIACDTGTVLAFDATGYAYNHIERSLGAPTTTIVQAREKLNERLSVEEERICVIPTEWNTEILAYEFVCTHDEETFYLYMDAQTLEEIKIMKVVGNMIA